MLKIWGRTSSINVRKVLWAAQELDIAFERTDAGHQFGVVKTAAYLAMNPNAQIPVIQDEAITLWESNVIVRYLCARHALGTLYPTSLAARFDAERWMDWQQTTLNPAGRNAFMQLIRTPPEQRQPALITQSQAQTEPLLALLDQHLSKQAFVSGEAFTMADIPLGCEIHRWFGLPLTRPVYPHLERWYAALCKRPGSQGVLDLALA